jgi:hypothetical protein
MSGPVSHQGVLTAPVGHGRLTDHDIHSGSQQLLRANLPRRNRAQPMTTPPSPITSCGSIAPDSGTAIGRVASGLSKVPEAP